MTVGPYETDNFPTITEAVAAAPNHTFPEQGYFVIYARAGLYEEYVVISNKKRNIMLIGDGINKTIISGNHSFIDGWTTYNSSTFGTYLFCSYIFLASEISPRYLHRD